MAAVLYDSRPVLVMVLSPPLAPDGVSQGERAWTEAGSLSLTVFCLHQVFGIHVHNDVYIALIPMVSRMFCPALWRLFGCSLAFLVPLGIIADSLPFPASTGARCLGAWPPDGRDPAIPLVT
jgi:hypothetical protein